MENLDDEITQAIDLAALRGDIPRKPKREKIDLYEVVSGSMAADSLPGLIRKVNEDSFACCTKPDGHLSLAVVADGIGGSEKGEIASTTCVAFLIREWRKFSSQYTDTTWEVAQEFLTQALFDVNDLIYRTSVQEKIPMGTTVAAIQFADQYAVIANAGDSRVYRLRDHQLMQLSTDHTPVAEALARGEISEMDALFSPFRHTITKAIGVAEFVAPQIRVVEHQPGDCYLLCSDGLTLHVTDEEIQKDMDACYDPVQCVDHLMKKTFRGGAHDNVTIISIFG